MDEKMKKQCMKEFHASGLTDVELADKLVKLNELETNESVKLRELDLKEQELKLKDRELGLKQQEIFNKNIQEVEARKADKKRRIMEWVLGLFGFGGVVIGAFSAHAERKQKKELMDKAIEFEKTGTWTTGVTKNIGNKF